MTLYVDSSALMKRYVREPDTERANQLLASDPEVVTARHTMVEVRRDLARLLEPTAAATARQDFAADLADISVVELDGATCEIAAAIAEQTGVRALDALHLGAARRLGAGISFLTFDVRQAEAARALGFRVLGS